MEKLTVIGCGNRNRGDDGVGSVVTQMLAARLKHYNAPNIHIFDAGTGGMDVMYRARGSSELIIVDACLSGSAAGAIFELPVESLNISEDPVNNTHEFKWQHAIYAGKKIYAEAFPENIRVILIEAASTALGLSLSEAVADAAERVSEQLFLQLLPRINSRVNRSRSAYQTALEMAADASLSSSQRATLLCDMAGEIQRKDGSGEGLKYSAELLRQAAKLTELSAVALARIHIRLAAVLLLFPKGEVEAWHEAYFLIEAATADLCDPEEIASAQMQKALLIQTLADIDQADIRQAIDCYQQAVAIFTADSHPLEYALIQNNLATIWLSLASAPRKRQWYEGMAIAAFESALGHIDQHQYPDEYAMLQNNLGNALQNSNGGNDLNNKRRAMIAYEQALNYRQGGSLLRANTLANQSQCLIDLPDCDSGGPNPKNLAQAHRQAQEAIALFRRHNEDEKAELMIELLTDIEQLIQSPGVARK